MKKLIFAAFCVHSFLLKAAVFAEEGQDTMPPRDQGLWQTMIMIAIALVFFYFILWRPEQKRRKVLETQRSSLKKGDRVTAMGIVGTVLKVQEHTVILKMYDNSAKIEVLKGAITDVIAGTEEETSKEETQKTTLNAKG